MTKIQFFKAVEISFRVGERQIDWMNISDLWRTWNTGRYIFVGKSCSEVHSLTRDDREMLQLFETINLEILNGKC
jgi:hypothetical protein